MDKKDMDKNDCRNQLIDNFMNNSKQAGNEVVVRLTPEQAEKKFYDVVELIKKTVREYSFGTFWDEEEGREELDKKIAKIFKKFPDILTIQDISGKNLGMIAAENELEQAVLVALDNEKASLQQDMDGYNIGMIAAENGLEQATLKALKNKKACKQRTFWGDDTIESLYQEYLDFLERPLEDLY